MYSADREVARLISRWACFVRAMERDEATYGCPDSTGSPTLFVDWDRVNPTLECGELLHHAMRVFTDPEQSIAAICAAQMENTSITQDMPILPPIEHLGVTTFKLTDECILEPYPSFFGLTPKALSSKRYRTSANAVIIAADLAMTLRTRKAQSLDLVHNILLMAESTQAPWRIGQPSVWQLNPPPFRLADSAMINDKVFCSAKIIENGVHLVCKPAASQGLSNRICTMTGAAMLANALCVGLIVIWTASEQCPEAYTDLFIAPTPSSTLGSIPFIRVMSEQEYLSFEHRHLALKKKITQFGMLDAVSNTIHSTCATLLSNVSYIGDAVHAIDVSSIIKYFTQFNACTESRSATFLAQMVFGTLPAIAPDCYLIGVHWRRTDLGPMLEKQSPGWDVEKASWLIVDKIKEQMEKYPNSLVFIATDSEEVFSEVMLQNKYKLEQSRIWFGPCHSRTEWNASKSVVSDLCETDASKSPLRQTSVRDFVDELWILRHCHVLILTNESTVKSIVVTDSTRHYEVEYVGVRTPFVHQHILKSVQAEYNGCLQKYFKKTNPNIPITVAWYAEKMSKECIIVLQSISDACVEVAYRALRDCVESKEDKWKCDSSCPGLILLKESEYRASKDAYEKCRSEAAQMKKCNPPKFMSAFIWGPMRLSNGHSGLPLILLFGNYLYCVQAAIPFEVLKNARALERAKPMVQESITAILYGYRYVCEDHFGNDREGQASVSVKRKRSDTGPASSELAVDADACENVTHFRPHAIAVINLEAASSSTGSDMVSLTFPRKTAKTTCIGNETYVRRRGTINTGIPFRRIWDSTLQDDPAGQEP